MEFAHNPFFLLGASLQDNRRRIFDLGEEKSLLTGEDGVREATATLTNPRKRLAAELAWIPGLAPKQIDQILLIGIGATRETGRSLHRFSASTVRAVLHRSGVDAEG